MVLKDGVQLTDDLKKEIEEHCKKNLARYSMPASFEYRDSLPRTLVGKIAYRELEKGND